MESRRWSALRDWQEASVEEQIPWIDVGDQQAFESESARLYGVAGIPSNYLARGGSGEIVGMHLRQRKLDATLAELYGEQAAAASLDEKLAELYGR